MKELLNEVDGEIAGCGYKKARFDPRHSVQVRYNITRKAYYKMNNNETTAIYHICKSAMECIVSKNYEPLRKVNALTRVSESDIKRVLAEYNLGEVPVMPPDSYIEKAAYINTYNDGSGYLIGINLWYRSGESDLTLQLDIRKKDNGLAFIIDDLHVL